MTVPENEISLLTFFTSKFHRAYTALGVIEGGRELELRDRQPAKKAAKVTWRLIIIVTWLFGS